MRDIAVDRARREMHADESDIDTDIDSNEDYLVFECPGLALVSEHFV